MNGNILAASTGIIGSADGPTSILVAASGLNPLVYVAIAAVVILAIWRIVASRSADEASVEQAQAPAAPAAPVAAPAADVPDEELVAVITAAVLAMEEGRTNGLVIRSIRYAGQEGTPWAAAGRRGLMSERYGRNHR